MKVGHGVVSGGEVGGCVVVVVTALNCNVRKIREEKLLCNCFSL